MKNVIDNLDRYDFEKAKAGDRVIVVTWIYGELSTIKLNTVKSVSLKRKDVTLDNGLKYSKDGCRYGRVTYDTNHICVYTYNNKNIEQVNKFIYHKNLAKETMRLIDGINMEYLMNSTNDSLRELKGILNKILERES